MKGSQFLFKFCLPLGFCCQILRGLIIGTLVTTAIFLSTSFKDIPSYLAGVAYGIIIDYVSTRYS